MVAPKRPTSFICSTMSCGYSSARSYLRATGRNSFSTHVSTASTNASWSRSLASAFMALSSLANLVLDTVAALGDQDRAHERAHGGPVLVGSRRLDGHDARAGA